MSNFILHITHTDINYDSRVLKEMSALNDFCHANNMKLYGIGLEETDKRREPNNSNFELTIYTCRRRLSKFFTKINFLKHAITFFELLLFSLKHSIKMKPKIIHCHDTLVLPIGLLIKFLSGARLIYDAHELESNKNLQSRVNSLTTLFIERISWRYIDLLISVSPSICKWYEKNLGEKKNVTILNSPNLIPKCDQDFNTFEIRKRFQITNSETLFVYLGILGPGRGIEKYLEAFAREDVSSHLLFVGWGEYEELIHSRASKYNNIHLHEAVTHTDVVPLVKECDYGLCMIESVSLSDYLCLPNKLFEYCFAHLPVLGSDLPELSRVINEYDFGQICSNSSEEIAKSVNEMSLTKKNYSFRRIEDLSWSSQEKKLIKNYNVLIKL